MSSHANSHHLSLYAVFLRLQTQMLAGLATSRLIEHSATCGTATEVHWLDLLHTYLPSRFRASQAFVLNSSGDHSRQIDIAIYDRLCTPPLFPNNTAPYIPIESVYAVFEVKPKFSRSLFRDAAEKIESVRSLSPTRQPILAGMLATTSDWPAEVFTKRLNSTLKGFSKEQRLTLGCALARGAFDFTLRAPVVSVPNNALAFFILRLVHHLNTQPAQEPADLLAYLMAAEPPTPEP